MTRSLTSNPAGVGSQRSHPGTARGYAVDIDPMENARRLRELAAWYRALAERAANPAIWEMRLLTAEDLDAEADRIDSRRSSL
jgi:hypothetical protein